MTTGSWLSGSQTFTNIGNHYAKSWSGADGKFRENAYSVSINSAVQSGSRLRIAGCGGGLYTQSVSTPVALTWPANSEAALAGKVIAAAKNHSFNLGVSAGEISETCRMVQSTAQRIGNALHYVRRGDLFNAFRSVGYTGNTWQNRRLNTSDAANAWLEATYGWRPLISDVYAGAEALASVLNPARRSSFVVTQNGPSYYSPNGPGNTHIYITARAKMSTRVKVTMVEQLSTPRQLGLTDPASIAWELTPLSFVIDWFIPIGDYLQAYFMMPQISATYVRSTQYTGRNAGYGLKDGQFCTPAASFWRKYTLSRTFNGPSVSGLRPTFSIPAGLLLDVNRMATTVSLIRQRERLFDGRTYHL